MNNKVYLAGPDVFRLEVKNYFEILKKECDKHGFEGISPIDSDLGETRNSNEIFNANLEQIRNCDFMIANLNPFRGVCMDDGTAFEIGYAWRMNKTIVGYSKQYDKTLNDVVDQFCDSKMVTYPVIENFGHPINLMIYHAVTVEHPIVATFNQALAALSKIVITRLIR